jgi:hypothetical protein
LFASVFRLVQPVEQYALVAVVHPHEPFVQTASSEIQAFPQAPQLLLSELSSTQAPPQQLLPAAQA